MKQFVKSIRFRLVLLVLLTVGPAFGLTLFTGLEARQQAYEKAHIDAMRIVRISGDSYTDAIASGKQLLTGLAQLPQVRRHDTAGCNDLFASVLKEFPEYANLVVVDPQGNIICSGISLADPVNIIDHEDYQQVLKTRQFSISNYMINREAGQSTIRMAYPVQDTSGQVKAVVMASINLSVLGKTLHTAQLPENSEFFIIDTAGNLLVRSPDPQQWVGKHAFDREIVKSIMQKKSGRNRRSSGDRQCRAFVCL